MNTGIVDIIVDLHALEAFLNQIKHNEPISSKIDGEIRYADYEGKQLKECVKKNQTANSFP